MRLPGFRFLVLAVFAAGRGWATEPIITSLAATPEPGMKAVRVRAVVRTDLLDRKALLTLTVGAREAVVRLAPGGDPSGTVVERVIWPTRVKPWTPAKPVLYQLQAAVVSGGRRLDRRVIRFPIRTTEVREGTVFLNGRRLAVRGAAGLSGTVLECDLKLLHTQGFNLLSLGGRAGDASAGTAAAREACAAHGLLVLEELAPLPALAQLRAAAPPAPDAAELDAHGLLIPFGCATAFTESCRARQADRLERQLEDIRFDTESPGYLVEGWEYLGGAVGHAHAPWLLAARLSRRLVETGSSPLVTLLVAGPAPLPRDLSVEWRLWEPPECSRASRTVQGRPSATPVPAPPPAWRPAPRAVAGAAGVFGAAGAFGSSAATAATASAAFVLPTVTRTGHWDFEARVRRGARTVATTREGFGVIEEPSFSQISFALLGEAPELERAFGGWIIPAEYADVAVIVRPARVGADALAAVGRRVAAGKRAIVLALDADDVAAVNAAGIFSFTLTGVPSLGRVHWFRPGPFSVRAPVARGAPADDPAATPRWLADEGDVPFLPVASLAPLPSATVYAGSVAGASDWAADIQVAQAGAGRVVFCQLSLLGHFDQYLARLTFLRLLGL